MARHISESLRNAPLKLYYTPQLCIVQDKPPYHDSFLLDDFQKKLVVAFFNDFHAAVLTQFEKLRKQFHQLSASENIFWLQ